MTIFRPFFSIRLIHTRVYTVRGILFFFLSPEQSTWSSQPCSQDFKECPCKFNLWPITNQRNRWNSHSYPASEISIRRMTRLLPHTFTCSVAKWAICSEWENLEGPLKVQLRLEKLKFLIKIQNANKNIEFPLTFNVCWFDESLLQKNVKNSNQHTCFQHIPTSFSGSALSNTTY